MFKLMMVTDRKRSPLPLADVVRRALAEGVDAVQLRERDLSAKELLGLAQELREITRRGGARLIINHRVDVAIASEADGVHLGWRSLSASEVRRLAGRRMLIGVSCHNEEQLRAAGMAGADYAILGPVFPTPSKDGLAEALGLERLRNCVRMAKLPVIAIGGIRRENMADVLACGVAGAAAISMFLAEVRL